VTDVAPPLADDSEALSPFFIILGVLIPSLAAGSASALVFRRTRPAWCVAAPAVVAVAIGLAAAGIADGVSGLGHYANLAPFGPAFLRPLHPALPLGAAADALRGAVYFDGFGTAGPVSVLAVWAVAGVTTLALVVALRRPTLARLVSVTRPGAVPCPGRPLRRPAERVVLLPGHHRKTLLPAGPVR
jgi:hypothetical protein